MPNAPWKLFVGAAILLSAGTAAAVEPRAVALHYEQGPATCPDESTFRGQVMARLGYDPFATRAPRGRVDVIVSGKGRSFVARLTIVNDGPAVSKDRDGAGGTCDALVESVATTVAMALDPIAANAPKIAPAAPAPPPPPADTPRPVAADPPLPVAPTESRWTGHLGAAGGAGFGELPGASLGALVAFELRRAALGLTVDARFAAAPGAFTSKLGDRVDASLLTAGPASCLYTGFFGACAHLRVGAIRARSETVVLPVDRAAFYGEVAASARVNMSLTSRFELGAFCELGAPLTPASLYVSGSEVWNAAPVFARLGFGGSMHVF